MNIIKIRRGIGLVIVIEMVDGMLVGMLLEVAVVVLVLEAEVKVGVCEIDLTGIDTLVGLGCGGRGGSGCLSVGVIIMALA